MRSGGGRANLRLSCPGRPALQPSGDRLAERPRPGEPGAGPRARLRRGHRHRGRFSLRPKIGYGTSDERVTGGLTLLAGTGATQLSLGAERQIRDFRRLPGHFADPQLPARPGSGRRLRRLRPARRGDRGRPSPARRPDVGRASARSRGEPIVGVASTPANGTYRPNPPLGAGNFRLVRASLERASGGMAVERDLQGRLSPRGGRGGRGEYFRAAAEARWLTGRGPGPPAHPSVRRSRHGRLPAYRSFALGGRGTLLGEPFRAYGGRAMALAHVEWRLEVPVPATAVGLLRQHRTASHRRAVPGGRLVRAHAPGPAVRGNRRCPAGGGSGLGVAHGPPSARGWA